VGSVGCVSRGGGWSPVGGGGRGGGGTATAGGGARGSGGAGGGLGGAGARAGAGGAAVGAGGGSGASAGNGGVSGAAGAGGDVAAGGAKVGGRGGAAGAIDGGGGAPATGAAGGGGGQAGRGDSTTGSGGRGGGGGGSGVAGAGGRGAGNGGGGASGSGVAGAGDAGAGGTPVVTCNAPAAMNFAGTPEPCASAAACAPDALGHSFSPPIRIDDGTDCSIRSVRALMASGAGPALLIWDAASPERVRVRRAAPGGAWSPVEPAGDGWGASHDVAMTAAGDALMVGGRGDHLVSTQSLGGAPWTALGDLGGSHGAADNAAGSIAVTTQPAGPALAVWSQGTSPAAYALWSPAGGWTATSAFASRFDRAAIAPLPGGGFAMGRISGGFVDLFTSASGATWGLGVNVGGLAAATDGARSSINIATDGAGRIHVVWTHPGSNGESSTALYREYEGDQTWVPFMIGLDNEIDTRVQPLVAASRSGDLIVVTASANSTRPHYTVRVREGHTWQEGRPLNFQTTPAVAMDDAGNALLVWARDDSQFGLVQASRYQHGVGWESAYVQTLHAGATGATSPAVAAAMSPSGQAVLGYVVRRPGEPDRVYAQTLR
jgi:hypothetical protein